MRAARSAIPVRRTSSPRIWKQTPHKNYYVIAYINCSAGVKALSDVICTSGNAVHIVNAAPKDRNILFVPDQNLGAWVMEQTGRKMELWKGNCYVHVEFTRNSIERIKAEWPDAPVVAHPECTHAVRLLADEVCSTEKMISYCRDSPMPTPSSLSPNPACCIACGAKSPARLSFPVPRISARAPIAGS